MSQSYLGIDLHKRRSYVVLMDEGVDVLDERALPNGDMAEYLAERVPRATTAVMEATFNWPFMYDLVSEHVERVLLAHPQKVKLIAEATVKTDKVDAHTLTHLARTGYLPESYAAPKWLRELRRLMRHRQNLIADHTRHKNRIHSVLHSYNLSSPLSDLFGSKGRAFLAELLCDPAGPLTPSACQVIEDSMAAIDFYNERIQGLDQAFSAYARTDPAIDLLRSLPGVGLISAITIRAELGEVERFRNGHQVARWAGLTPKVLISDQMVRHGSITREGSTYLRQAMVSVALRAVRFSPSMRAFYQRLAKRRGSGIARVALARKLVILSYQLLRTGQPYREGDR